MGAYDRRGFLRNLASLPFIGGGVTLIGNPTAAAEPVSARLLESYDAWLFFERRYLRQELARVGGEAIMPLDRKDVLLDFYPHHVWADNPGGNYHMSADPSVWPQPSSRAAIVLSAVGCDWRGA